MSGTSDMGEVVIRVEQAHNPWMRTYHADRQICQAGSCSIKYPFDDVMNGSSRARLAEADLRLAAFLVGIPGVEEANLDTHRMYAVIGRVFEWDAIEPEIIAAIKRAAVGLEMPAHVLLPAPDKLVVGFEEAVNNELMGKVHFGEVISETWIWAYDGISRFEPDDLAPVGPIGTSLVQRLMALPKITEVYLRPYSLTLQVDRQESWLSAIEELKSAIASVFPNRTIEARVIPKQVPLLPPLDLRDIGMA